jgi:hypothetical protein
MVGGGFKRMLRIADARLGTSMGAESMRRRPGNLTAAPALIEGHGRSRRVLLLVGGIILLSMGDLVVTVAFLQAQWMLEANPIAAALIRSTQSPWALAAFKAASVGIFAAVLLRLRRHRVCEVAAWAGMAILAATAVMWSNYADHFEDPASGVLLVQLGSCNDPLSLPY